MLSSSSSSSLSSRSPQSSGTSSTAAPTRVSKRLIKELAQLQKDPPPYIAAWPIKDNVHKLHAQLCGPAESPYEGGVFTLELSVPESYPLDPPSVSFVTPVYHPNVDERGRVCLDTLSLPPKGCWSPALTLASLLTTVHQLMAYPNGQDGLVREIAEVFNGDRHTFNQRARSMTQQHAMQQQQRQQEQHDQPSTQDASSDGVAALQQPVEKRADQSASPASKPPPIDSAANGKRQRDDEAKHASATPADTGDIDSDSSDSASASAHDGKRVRTV